MIEFKGFQFPDIFLAGMPKSGTTFLFDLISSHPGIQGSEPKEPFYYIDSTSPFFDQRIREKKQYSEFYTPLRQDKLQMDGTTQTAFQNFLLETLELSTEKPKVIFVLREPAQRILSSFQFTSNNLSAVKAMSFGQYVDFLLEGDKTAIEKECRNERASFSLQNELDYSKYVLHLERWRRAVGEANMKILLFEELKNNPKIVAMEVFSFLNLDPAPISFPDRDNKSVSVKNKRLHFVLHNLYGKMGYKFPFKKTLKRIYSSFQHADDRMIQKDGASIQKLKAYFTDYNNELRDQFHIDLRPWE